MSKRQAVVPMRIQPYRWNISGNIIRGARMTNAVPIAIRIASSIYWRHAEETKPRRKPEAFPA
jgi:hypothetical protein